MSNNASEPAPIVIKIGGSTLGSGDTTLEDVAALRRRGVLPVIVHGGGKVISQWMERTGAMPRFVRGLRVTDAATLEVVVAVLAGLVNKQLVASLQALGTPAVGLSGADGALFQGRVLDPELGLVGEVATVDPGTVQAMLKLGYVPVVAPVALAPVGADVGRRQLKIKGVTAAGAQARAQGAQRLLFLTDVDGILDTSRRLIPRLLPEQARALIQSGVVAGGMIPKVEACLYALPRVAFAQIVDGRKPHALQECFDGRLQGTRVG
ncbi:MAG: acetylglutamate kinase [Chloroflexi bacterium]|nr:acetylglutamate kinase [Chloroflexota bacterium]